MNGSKRRLHFAEHSVYLALLGFQFTAFFFVSCFNLLVVIVLCLVLFLEIFGIRALEAFIQPRVFPREFVAVMVNIFAVFTANEVPAVDVINVAIVVIVFAIAGNFARINPHDALQVFVVYFDARVKHRYDDGLAFFVFGLHHLDGRIGTRALYAVFGFV